MSRKKVAVFASGTGSNFKAMLEEDIHCDIVLLVCDQPDAPAINIAKENNIETFVFRAKEYPSKEKYENEIVGKLQEKKVSWIFLAGFMRLVGDTLLQAYEGKIINIHPSFLPAYPGKDAIGQAYEAGVSETGVTVHYVDEGMDTGPAIAQEVVPIHSADTKEILQQRIQKVEHRLYPNVIRNLMKN